jgi:hypothetical protein
MKEYEVLVEWENSNYRRKTCLVNTAFNIRVFRKWTGLGSNYRLFGNRPARKIMSSASYRVEKLTSSNKNSVLFSINQNSFSLSSTLHMWTGLRSNITATDYVEHFRICITGYSLSTRSLTSRNSSLGRSFIAKNLQHYLLMLLRCS